MISQYEKFVSELNTTPPIECKFSVGDKVTFTNDNGVRFLGLKVIGFDSNTEFYGRFIYLDYECYWFPVSPDSLEKE